MGTFWSARQPRSEQLVLMPLSVSASTLIIHSALSHNLPKLLHDLPLPTRRRTNRQVLPPINLGLPVPRVSTDHDPTGLVQDTPTRSNIPSPASALPVKVQLARSHGRQIQ